MRAFSRHFYPKRLTIKYVCRRQPVSDPTVPQQILKRLVLISMFQQVPLDWTAIRWPFSQRMSDQEALVSDPSLCSFLWKWGTHEKEHSVLWFHVIGSWRDFRDDQATTDHMLVSWGTGFSNFNESSVGVQGWHSGGGYITTAVDNAWHHSLHGRKVVLKDGMCLFELHLPLPSTFCMSCQHKWKSLKIKAPIFKPPNTDIKLLVFIECDILMAYRVIYHQSIGVNNFESNHNTMSMFLLFWCAGLSPWPRAAPGTPALLWRRHELPECLWKHGPARVCAL